MDSERPRLGLGFAGLLLCIITMTAPTAASEITPTDSTPLDERRTLIYLAWANRLDNDRGADVEAGLIGLGFADPYCSMWGCNDLPSGGPRYVAGYLALGHRVGRRVELRLSRNGGNWFVASGYDAGTSRHIDVDASLASYGLECWYALQPALWVGAGVVEHRLSVTGQIEDDVSLAETEWSSGLFVGAAVIAPVRSLVFFHLTAGYHVAPEVDLELRKTADAIPISIAHTTWSLGIGLRL